MFPCDRFRARGTFKLCCELVVLLQRSKEDSGSFRVAYRFRQLHVDPVAIFRAKISVKGPNQEAVVVDGTVGVVISGNTEHCSRRAATELSETSQPFFGRNELLVFAREGNIAAYDYPGKRSSDLFAEVLNITF